MPAFSALMLSVASALPAHADEFDPAVVNVTLGPGESTTVQKTLQLDALPGSADIILAIDTTGSMSGPIAQAKAEATQLCNDIKAEIPGARFAVVDFKDYPLPPYGVATDFPYLLKTPGFVVDCATVQAAINTMVASGGADIAESYNRVFFEAYSDPVLVYNPEAEKLLIVLGDAPPHDPDQTVAPACGSRPPVDPGRDNIAGTADDLHTEDTIAGLNANNITLLMILYNNFLPLACYEELAGATDGTAVTGGGGETLSDTIIAQIEESSSQLDEVELVVSGAGCQTAAGLTISFNPEPPYGPFTAPVEINFEETVTAPATPGDYSCTVTAVVDGTPRATQVVDVTVLEVFPEGRMTGGGNLTNAEGTRVTFGLKLHCDVAETPTNLQVNWGRNRFHLEEMTMALCTDDPGVEPNPPAGDFDTHRGSGSGRYNGQSGATAQWRLTDRGEPGRNDSVEITITNASGDIVLVAAGNLEGGNLQAHDN